MIALQLCLFRRVSDTLTIVSSHLCNHPRRSRRGSLLGSIRSTSAIDRHTVIPTSASSPKSWYSCLINFSYSRTMYGGANVMLDRIAALTQVFGPEHNGNHRMGSTCSSRRQHMLTKKSQALTGSRMHLEKAGTLAQGAIPKSVMRRKAV